MCNYLKCLIYHVFLFLMLCTLLGLDACISPQLNELNYPDDFDSSATSPVDPALNDQPITLHLILIADTDDISIGESTKIDLRNIQRLMEAVADQSLDKIVLKPLIKDKRITQKELLDIIQHLRVQRQDIIVFHWAGHGSSGAKWPSLNTVAKATDFKQIIKLLNSKKARQMIVLADCYNAPLIDTQAKYAPKHSRRQYFFPENIEKMFIKPEIKIIASGNQTDQVASGTNSLGGYFTYNFIISLEEALLNENNPDSAWEKVMQTTRQRVLFDTRNEQAPQYIINPSIDSDSNTINEGDIKDIDNAQGELDDTDVKNKELGGAGNFEQLLNKILRENK